MADDSTTPVVDTFAGGEDNSADTLEFQSKVDLKKVDVKVGEEEEEVCLKLRSKLYIFIEKDIYGGEERTNYWKERGTGDVKLLKHKTMKKVRLLMRQEKTLKICANHLVSPGVELQPNVGSDRSFVFSAADFAEEQLETITFAIRFGSVENAELFKKTIELAKKINAGSADADELKPISDSSDDGELEKKISAHTASRVERRESLSAINASQDSDHDSQAEDVNEGEEARLKATVGDPAAAALSEGMVNVSLGNENSAGRGLCGGFKVVEASQEGIDAIVEFTVSAISKGTLVEVIEVQQQVVAGMNYKLQLKIKHEDDSSHIYSAKVFKPLPHTGLGPELKEQQYIGSA